MRTLSYITAVLAISLSSVAIAAEDETALKADKTTQILIDTLVKQGVLDPNRARQIVEEASTLAEEEVKRQEREEAEGKTGVIRVPYVPNYVIEEVRSEIRDGMRGDVVQDILAQAEYEGWGVPQALPLWIQRLNITGDIRFRVQSDLFSEDNTQDPAIPTFFRFVDFNKANSDGSTAGAFLNVTENRNRMRIRARLGIDAELDRDTFASIRIATGSEGVPTSTNETLDGDFGSKELVLDRAFVTYKHLDDFNFNWFTFYGGRMKNPFFKTDLVWDSDVNLDGVTGRFNFDFTDYDRGLHSKTMYVLLGAYSIDEISLSDDDKMLFAAQVAGKIKFPSQNVLKAGLAFYNYHNITGVRNAVVGQSVFDYTAPGYVQKGNSMFNIRNTGDPTDELFGLASDYDLLNLTMSYEIPFYPAFDWEEEPRFNAFRIIITADYVENIGYDAAEIRNRTGFCATCFLVNSSLNNSESVFEDQPENEQTTGYMLKVQLGVKKMLFSGDWQATFAYKSLERDAVLDAFTDSDFHLGGTNAEGWVVGGKYAFDDNAWVQARYLSADEITGPPLGIDVIQLDLVTRF